MEYKHTNRLIDGAKEVTIVGNRNNDDVWGLLKRLGEIYVPDRVIYLLDQTEEGLHIPEFAEGKTQKEGRVTVHICQNFTCSEPLTELEDIVRLL